MRIIIAPAKKMVVDTDSFAVDSLPQFLEQTERLKTVLQSMSPMELQSLWKCNDSIAKLNLERLEQLDLRRSLTPAIIAYEGIQYRYMAPGVMEATHLDYLREHLRILSGLYGLLRPFDGVTPYRLEMQAKLAADGFRDLYQFWGDRLARQLASETDFVLNLASKEYSRAVEPHLPKTVQLLTCTFGEWKDGKTRCKWANPNNAAYLHYHDEEWGVPVHEDHKLFEMLILECFQAGLSWECILNKQEAFRKAFDGFDLEKVCAYDEEKIEELCKNKEIIRNRLKINADGGVKSKSITV